MTIIIYWQTIFGYCSFVNGESINYCWVIQSLSNYDAFEVCYSSLHKTIVYGNYPVYDSASSKYFLATARVFVFSSAEILGSSSLKLSTLPRT